jgi:hypothetical protein
MDASIQECAAHLLLSRVTAGSLVLKMHNPRLLLCNKDAGSAIKEAKQSISAGE